MVLGVLHSHVQISIKGASPAGEGEEWQRYRDWHIHANHAYFDLVLVLACGWARLGEDGGAVAVRIPVHQCNGLIQVVCLHSDTPNALSTQQVQHCNKPHRAALHC